MPSLSAWLVLCVLPPDEHLDSFALFTNNAWASIEHPLPTSPKESWQLVYTDNLKMRNTASGFAHCQFWRLLASKTGQGAPLRPLWEDSTLGGLLDVECVSELIKERMSFRSFFFFNFLHKRENTQYFFCFWLISFSTMILCFIYFPENNMDPFLISIYIHICYSYILYIYL